MTANLTANSSDGPVCAQSGVKFTLSWSSGNADSCTLTNEQSGSTVNVATTGSDPNYSVTANTTFRLDCSNSCGNSATDRVTANACTLPTRPAPVSPSDGQRLWVTNPTLTWAHPTNWGATCSGSSKGWWVCVATTSARAGETDPNRCDVVGVSLGYDNDPNGDGRSAHTLSGLSLGSQYYWRIKATNGCGEGISQSEPYWSFYTPVSVSGTVYRDQGNTCSTATRWTTPQATVRLTAESNTLPGCPAAGTTAAVSTNSSNGTYAFASDIRQPCPYTLSVDAPANHYCSNDVGGLCVQGSCSSYINLTNANTTSNDFFLAQVMDAWWQVMGGGVYAGGAGNGAITSSIPSTVPAASRYLVLPGADGSTEGVVMHASTAGASAVSLGTGGGIISDPDFDDGVGNYNPLRAQSTYPADERLNFDFWKKQLNLPQDLSGVTIGNLTNKPATPPPQGYYYRPGDSTLSGTWSVTAGQSYIIFVDGNLTISSNITVANGGFLAFIVHGRTQVSANVTQVKGVFISDGNFETLTAGSQDDTQLTIAGSVVSWGNIFLRRHMGVSNNTGAAEVFTYSPTLMQAMPEKMRVFEFSQREVDPGSFN